MTMIESQTLKSFLIVALCFPIVLCSSHWINVHCNFAFAGPLTVIIGIGHFILYLYLANKIRKVQLENYAQTNTSMIHLSRHNLNELIVLGLLTPFVLSFIHRICMEYQNLWIEILFGIAYILIYWIFILGFKLKGTI